MSIRAWADKAVDEWNGTASGGLGSSGANGVGSLFESPIWDMSKELCFSKGYEAGAGKMLMLIRERAKKAKRTWMGNITPEELDKIIWQCHPMFGDPTKFPNRDKDNDGV